MRVYFVRHGESVANRLQVLSNRRQPHPLTELGRRQAAEVAPLLTGVCAIYASAVPRAAETAAIIGALLGLPVVTTAALGEFDCGVMEGRGDEAAWNEWRRVWRAWQAGEHEARVAGGECYHDVRERFVPFVREVVAQPGEGDVVLVGHGGLFMSQLPNVLANVTPEFAWSNPVAHALPVAAECQPDGSLFCTSWCCIPLVSKQ